MMRSIGIVALLVGYSLAAPAAEPAKVSVYPAPTVGTAPANATVLEGTTVSVPAASADCTPCPPHRTRLVDRFLSVTPTVASPEMTACDPCDRPSRFATMFRGSVLSSGCGSDVCASPGRPALFGKCFLACPTTPCSTPCAEPAKCQSESCSTCARGLNRSASCGSGHCWDRFKNWICFRPCDGPRVPLCRPEPYTPATMTVFPASCPVYGTCHASACTGMNRFGLGQGQRQGCGLGMGAGLFANGSACGDGSGLGLGLAGRLAGHFHGKGTKDCNDAEPKLSGEPLVSGYRFATIEPKNYHRQATIVDPIAGTVKGPQNPEPKPAAKTSAIVQTKMEVPAAAPAMAKPTMPSQAPAMQSPAPSAKAAPAAKPIMATSKWNSKSQPEGRSLSTPFTHQ